MRDSRRSEDLSELMEIRDGESLLRNLKLRYSEAFGTKRRLRIEDLLHGVEPRLLPAVVFGLVAHE